MVGLGSRWWRALVGVGVGVGVVLASLAGCAGPGGPGPRAAAGAIDLRGWDFGRDGIAALDGQWLLHWDAFDDPREPAPANARPVAVPAPWQAPDGGPDGRASYHLAVQCERRGGMALSLPVQHSAVRWFVNGALVAVQGEPGASERGAQGLPVQQTVALGDVACPLHITAHVSNFDVRQGGLVRSVELGELGQLVARREAALVRDLLAMGGLLVLGVMPLLFFIGRPQEKSPLHFSFFCLSFALVLGLTGTRVLQPLLAARGWSLYLQLLFVGWWGINVFFTTFVRSLYPQHVSAAATRAVVAWGALSSLAVLATGPQVFTRLLPMLVAGSALTCGYLAWRLAVAARAGRRTARLLLAGLALLIVAVVHDVLAYAHLSRLTLLPYGVLLFVAAPAYQMARRFARALRVEERIAIEERERADLLVRSTKAGLLDWDAIGGRVEWSQRLREMLGYPPAAQAPQLPAFRELLHPDDHDRVHGSFLRQLKDRGVRSGVRVHEPMDYQLRRADGEYLWVHAEAVSVCDREGRTLRYICSFIDISDRKLHEAQMRVQVELTRTEQRRLDLVVWGARVGIVDWDGYTHETYYSPRFCEIRGYDPDTDTAGWPDYFQVMIHPDDRERVTRRWVAFIRGKGPEGPLGEYYSPEEYRLVRRDGGYVWVQVSGMAVRDAQGFVVRWIAAIIDITEHREQQRALRDSRDQIAAQAALLEQQNEALKENVRLREEVERIGRHDLKTPLNSIISVPRLLRDEGRLDADADELLGIVERAGYRILSMVNLSLDLVKMEQGSYIFRPDAVDLRDLVDKVLADLRLHAASKGTTFEVDMGGAGHAWAEELLCYSLLANLVKNAVEASPDGSRVRIRAQGGADGMVRLHIHNEGEVPAAVRARFFDKYATAGKSSGTGLGTYSALLMARVQDGDVAMRSSAGEGTTLSVTLRAAPEGVAPAAARHLSERIRAGRVPIASLAPRHVLLVDDDEYNLLVVRRYLPTPPFSVDTATDGRMALAAAQRHWPDVVLMDLDMPVMGGLAAVGALRAIERETGARRCAIVALSSHEDAATQAAALAAGFDHYLTKPVTREVVHDTLVALQAGGTAAGAAVPPAPASGSADAPVLVDVDLEPALPAYLVSRRALVATLDASLREGDRPELRRVAHQLSGSLGLYGFHWASDQCRWIERHHADVGERELAAVVGALQAHLGSVPIRFVTVDDGFPVSTDPSQEAPCAPRN